MANIFVPFNLKIRDLTSTSAIVEWDLDNTVEFKAGTYYNVYTSNDGVAFTFLAKANVKYISIPMREGTIYVKVSSFVVGMGESAHSSALAVTQQIGTLDTTDLTTIAVTPSGEPVKLRATANGELLVSAASFSMGGVTITGFSTEAKQDAMIAGIATVNSNVTAFKDAVNTDLDAIQSRLVLFQNEAHVDSVNVLNKLDAFKVQNNTDILALKLEVANFRNANHTDLDALKLEVTGFKNANHADFLALGTKVDTVNTTVGTVKTAVDSFATTNNTNLVAVNTKLEDVKTKLDTLNLSVQDSNLTSLIRADTTLTNVSPAGALAILPWKRRSIVHQITVLKEGGAATRWFIEIINKAYPITERNVVCRLTSYESVDPDRTDILRTVPYVNLDNADEIRIRIVPDNGTSNQFAVIVAGETAK